MCVYLQSKRRDKMNAWICAPAIDSVFFFLRYVNSLFQSGNLFLYIPQPVFAYNKHSGKKRESEEARERERETKHHHASSGFSSGIPWKALSRAPVFSLRVFSGITWMLPWLFDVRVDDGPLVRRHWNESFD